MSRAARRKFPNPSAAALIGCMLLAVGANLDSAASDDNLEFIGRYPPDFFAELQDVELSNGRAYVFGVGGLAILDIDDPAMPQSLGRYEPPGHPYVRFYRGAVGVQHAYGAMREDGISVIDISFESQPGIINVYGSSQTSYEGLALAGDILYAARHDAGIEVIDVSDPSLPQQLLELGELSNSWDLVIEGDYGFVADGAGGLAVLDVSDPAATTWLYSLATAGAALDVDVEAGLAFLACGSAGVEIFDVADPENAVWLGNYNSSGLAITLDAVGDKIYLADWDDVEVLDVQIPSSPSRYAWENTPVRAMGLAAEFDRVYVADWSDFKIYDLGATMLGDLEVHPRNLFFGDVPLGATVDSSLTISNTGGSELGVLNIQTYNPNFAVLPPHSFDLAPGEEREIIIEYTHASPGYDGTYARIDAADPDESFINVLLGADDNPNNLQIGEPAPDFTLYDLDGGAHSLSDYLGRVIVLAFFANW